MALSITSELRVPNIGASQIAVAALKSELVQCIAVATLGYYVTRYVLESVENEFTRMTIVQEMRTAGTLMFSIFAALFVKDSSDKAQLLAAAFTLSSMIATVYLSTHGQKNKFTVTEMPQESFKDVIGNRKAKATLETIAEAIAYPEKRAKSDPDIKAVLLYGAPGNGKTMMAKALAHELGQEGTNVAFFAANGADFEGNTVGSGVQAIKQLFGDAKRHLVPSYQEVWRNRLSYLTNGYVQASAKRHAVIFIDEIDTLTRERTRGVDSARNPHANSTPGAFLSELEGFAGLENITVVGATNLLENLSHAAASRFASKIEVTLPTEKDRDLILFNLIYKGMPYEMVEKILIASHEQGVKNPTVLRLPYLAQLTEGFSGRDLKNVVDLARQKAVTEKREIINGWRTLYEEDLTDAIDEVKKAREAHAGTGTPMSEAASMMYL